MTDEAGLANTVRSGPRSDRGGLRDRIARQRASHAYRTTLALVVASFVFAATAPDAAWSRGAFLLLSALTLLAAGWTSAAGPATRVGAVAIVVAVALAATEVAFGGSTLEGAAAAVSALLVIATLGTIARGLVSKKAVDEQSVIGAICIYLLLGIFFLFVYSAVAVLGSGPLFVQGTDGSPALRLYFSFVTLTTVGYGDYTAASDLGHTLAITEALLGQLYLVTVVAILVSRIARPNPEGV